MRKNCIIFTVILSFLWFNIISESGTTNVSACTNFKIKDDQTVYFGNSEDQTYTQFSETYITFIPIGQVWYDGATIEHGTAIVGYANGSGYSWVQGGINDQGLAFDSTFVPYTAPNLHNERSPLLIPQIFNCGTIDEVIESMNQHSIYSVEGKIQTFFVDKTGESVVYNIGEDGELAVFRTNDSYQLATNYYVDDPFRGNPGSDPIERYRAAEEKLNDIVKNDDLTIKSITSVLKAVHFEGANINTIYSNIFDVTNGDIYLYFFHQFKEVVKLNLEEELAKGRHSYRIVDFFTQETVENAYKEYNAYPYMVREFFADIILLIGTGILDFLLIIAMMFVLGKKSFQKLKETKNTPPTQSREEERQKIDSTKNSLPLKGFNIHVILILALIWSFLSFPMIYWNRKGEWFSLKPLPFPPFYEYYHLFLSASVLGVFFIAFLLSSTTSRGEVVRLVKRGIALGKSTKWSLLAFLTLPVLIELFYICLDFLNIVPNVDWLVLVITYPLIAAILLFILAATEKKTIGVKEFSQARWIRSIIQTNLQLILIWGLWFLPLFLTIGLDQTYILLLLTLSTSMISFSFFETLKRKNSVILSNRGYNL